MTAFMRRALSNAAGARRTWPAACAHHAALLALRLRTPALRPAFAPIWAGAPAGSASKSPRVETQSIHPHATVRGGERRWVEFPRVRRRTHRHRLLPQSPRELACTVGWNHRSKRYLDSPGQYIAPVIYTSVHDVDLHQRPGQFTRGNDRSWVAGGIPTGCTRVVAAKSSP